MKHRGRALEHRRRRIEPEPKNYLLTVQILVSAEDESVAFDFVDAILTEAQNGWGSNSMHEDGEGVFLGGVIKENKRTIRMHL